ncbi:MAG TPA: glycoside hydrolase N-terminal domain-containing protein [Puia sp.]|nr:glycoside hydrolase N-terminal domain-containing protein [Puia sp.]
MNSSSGTLWALLIALLPCNGSAQTHSVKSSNHILWFRYPAKYWNSQELHLGNGRIGASFSGGIPNEVFSLTEKSVWFGKPFSGDWKAVGVNPKARQSLPAIRAAIVSGNVALADSLARRDFLGNDPDFGGFSSLGELILSSDSLPYADYTRKLDLDSSIGSVQYRVKDVIYRREYFCSYPDNVLALKFSASAPHQINLRLSLRVIQDHYQILTNDRGIEIPGQIDGNGRPFRISIAADAPGGSVHAEGQSLVIRSANSLVIYVTASTNYALHYPDYTGESPETKNSAVLSNALKLGYEILKKRHIDDYRRLYARVSLDLRGDSLLEKLPTNERWERMRSGSPDRGLKELTFNLGRYLIISASRPGTLPANLQGNWNTYKISPWAGNYQSNINLQEIYWACGPANLLEYQQAYLDWISDLTIPGAAIAKQVYGTDGWVSHSTGNIWGHAAPYGGMGWGLYPIANAWHCQHVWDQFRFSQDTNYLKHFAYPILRGASIFWLENLVPYKGYLISAPAISAEHGALDSAGHLNPASHDLENPNYRFTLPGAYQDIEMVWDLFTNTASAAKQLGHQAFADSLLHARSKLLPLKIGRYGQLQEWYWDIDRLDGHHRHIAHLYAVCPGDEISPLITPALAKAAAQSLNMRGEKRYPVQENPSGGNWSRADRIACWVRLQDGDRANKIFTELLTEEGFENLLTFQHATWSNGRPDLYKENDSTFLVFQLDASAAVPFFMSEMLLQSQLGDIQLLPALPSEWPDGSVRGLLARGGYTVDIEWAHGQLKSAVIRGTRGANRPAIRIKNTLVKEPDPRIKYIASNR